MASKWYTMSISCPTRVAIEVPHDWSEERASACAVRKIFTFRSVDDVHVSNIQQLPEETAVPPCAVTFNLDEVIPL